MTKEIEIIMSKGFPKELNWEKSDYFCINCGQKKVYSSNEIYEDNAGNCNLCINCNYGFYHSGGSYHPMHHEEMIEEIKRVIS